MVIWVELTTVGVTALLLNVAVDPLTNPVPVIVSVVAAELASMLAGLRAVTTGAGLSTSKLRGVEAPPPGEGFETTTGNVPAALKSVDARLRVNWVPLTNVAA
jgi:hypothetical protein